VPPSASVLARGVLSLRDIARQGGADRGEAEEDVPL
jgi:hypothetical protein